MACRRSWESLRSSPSRGGDLRQGGGTVAVDAAAVGQSRIREGEELDASDCSQTLMGTGGIWNRSTENKELMTCIRIHTVNFNVCITFAVAAAAWRRLARQLPPLVAAAAVVASVAGKLHGGPVATSGGGRGCSTSCSAAQPVPGTETGVAELEDDLLRCGSYRAKKNKKEDDWSVKILNFRILVIIKGPLF